MPSRTFATARTSFALVTCTLVILPSALAFRVKRETQHTFSKRQLKPSASVIPSAYGPEKPNGEEAFRGAQEISQDFGCFGNAGYLGSGGSGSAFRVTRVNGSECGHLQEVPIGEPLVVKVCDCICYSGFTMKCDSGNSRVSLCVEDLAHECDMVRTVVAHNAMDGERSPSHFAQCFAQRLESQIPHLVFSFADGTPMDKLIFKQQGGFTSSSRLTLDIALELFEALQEIHAASIVHGDVKPDNAVWPPFKLLDFGFARKVAERFPPGGDERYLAPEVLQSDIMHFPRDVWAAGVFSIELLCAQSASGATSFTNFALLRGFVPKRSFENAGATNHEMMWGYGGLGDEGGAKLKLALAMYCGPAKRTASTSNDTLFLKIYTLLRDQVLDINPDTRSSAQDLVTVLAIHK